MSFLNIVYYTVAIIVVAVMALVVVPALISAKSTPLVLVGFGIIVAAVVGLILHFVKLFKGSKQDGK